MNTGKKPVVLVHGLATSAQRTWIETGWVDLLGDLGRDPVITVDLPGHGGTAPWPDESDYDRLDDVVLEAIEDEPVCDAIGFSLGARLLLGVAARGT